MTGQRKSAVFASLLVTFLICPNSSGKEGRGAKEGIGPHQLHRGQQVEGQEAYFHLLLVTYQVLICLRQICRQMLDNPPSVAAVRQRE